MAARHRAAGSDEDRPTLEDLAERAAVPATLELARVTWRETSPGGRRGRPPGHGRPRGSGADDGRPGDSR